MFVKNKDTIERMEVWCSETFAIVVLGLCFSIGHTMGGFKAFIFRELKQKHLDTQKANS